jgi:crotonobetainyl-CoA:carnitine CoA-transferase CaiB-like acyl-CoA transferase
MSITGEPGGAPVRAGAPIGDVGGGILAAQGILAALYARERMGEGQRVEVSLLGAQLYILTYEANHYLLSGKIPGPLENSGHRFIPAYGVFGTKDSYIAVATVPEESVFRLFKAVGRGDLVTDPRFDSIPKRLENKSQLASIFREVFPAKTTEEWLDILNREDVPCSPVNNFRDVFADPQVLQQDMVATIDWEGEQLKQVGNPIRLSATPEGMRNTYLPPPHVGQHTDEVLSQVLGYSEEEIRQLRDEGVVY